MTDPAAAARSTFAVLVALGLAALALFLHGGVGWSAASVDLPSATCEVRSGRMLALTIDDRRLLVDGAPVPPGGLGRAVTDARREGEIFVVLVPELTTSAGAIQGVLDQLALADVHSVDVVVGTVDVAVGPAEAGLLATVEYRVRAD